jgi:hypothetical protein
MYILKDEYQGMRHGTLPLCSSNTVRDGVYEDTRRQERNTREETERPGSTERNKYITRTREG